MHTSTFTQIDEMKYRAQADCLHDLINLAALAPTDRQDISQEASQLVQSIRAHAAPGLMEVFLAEYGLSTDEGVALMCLAEALLRVPDTDTIDALIEDKIAPSDWARHLGHSSSPLVNASTWALMLTGKVLEAEAPAPASVLRGALKRVGEPVIRLAVSRAMKEMGRQFVLGETISSALKRGSEMEAKGYTYSYDMLGEAALTEADAARYQLSYSDAISEIAKAARTASVQPNPGISVKLSALHPRYEVAQEARVMAELVPRLSALAVLAKAAGIGLNIDAEEADRLTLSLQVMDAVLRDPALAGWDGFGLVIQAYGPRAPSVIDAAYDMACRYDRRIMVRLVKGAYWDSEIKRAQVEGIDGFPVFTSKAVTDVSYIACARKMLGMTDRIYPQFATHNAHTMAAILHMADDVPFEFQRLHGMGETLHDIVKAKHGTRCRIYAPVGAHRDLLAYLVRRLLENGANSSFVNQIVDETVPADTVAADPFPAAEEATAHLPTGPDLFQPERRNSAGYDLAHPPTLKALNTDRDAFKAHVMGDGEETPIVNPARPDDIVGHVRLCTPEDVDTALANAAPWSDNADRRCIALNAAADLYEAHDAEIFALLSREAGKTLPDCVAELREAVDFVRYYAANIPDAPPVGRFVCISPWNFPLAIFTGQIAAALAAGNAVLAKPAEQTPLIASLAVALLHKAGVPQSALQLLSGDGSIGAALVSDPRTDGVAFTGSTATAKRIQRAMAENLKPGAPLIAETGGLNAMIVDSTALLEQAVTSVVESAFQSAGQRCSALRCLYVQEDIADDFVDMLTGAMDQLQVGDPWLLQIDCGPVIDQTAQRGIQAHIDQADQEGRLMHRIHAPANGTFIAPTLIRVSGIEDLKEEVFGPVLHLATFKAEALPRVIDAINGCGYGLTFGIHTRIDDRVDMVTNAISAGNIYVNRNQIGAIVGSQPFGGEGLSGTGPKAGGPHYLNRFGVVDDASGVQVKSDTTVLPGPTGESNTLSLYPRAPILCLGPGRETADTQAARVQALGGIAKTRPDASNGIDLSTVQDIGGAVWWGPETEARQYAMELASRDGPIVPLITGMPDMAHVMLERHVCIDTTASGGNASLLSDAANAT